MPDEFPRNSLQYDEYSLRVLSEREINTLSSFDCRDDDLNDFFRNECIAHRKELMAETYVFTESNKSIALISFCNDSIELSKSVRKHILPFPMRHYTAIPAVKIVRLGVFSEHQRRGIGSLLLDFCKVLFVTDNRTGCRVITVDAYNNDHAIHFYRNQGFAFLSEEDAERDTRIMWCDLLNRMVVH